VENPEAAALPLDAPPPTAAPIARPLPVARWVALLQAFSVCGVPSQLVIATVLMLLGRRPVLGEALRGLALLPVVFVAVTGIVVGLRAVAPWLHSVQQSPLESFMRSPIESAIFLVVVVLAGGVREELQRAFILHRFDQSLGGVQVGLVVFSLTFAALHIDQGYDVALAIGTLGLLWGIIYAKRRSAVMPMVNHACFNAAQVAQQVIARSLGA
jgi:membrane protease YdiL (CAAX protease family)